MVDASRFVRVRATHMTHGQPEGALENTEYEKTSALLSRMPYAARRRNGNRYPVGVQLNCIYWRKPSITVFDWAEMKFEGNVVDPFAFVRCTLGEDAH